MAKECIECCPQVEFYKALISIELAHNVSPPKILSPGGYRLISIDQLVGGRWKVPRNYRRIAGRSQGLEALARHVAGTYKCAGPARVDASLKILGGDTNHVLRCSLTGYGLIIDNEGNPTSVVNYHGDYISVGDNSVVANRSIVLNSYNKLESRYGTEAVQALGELERIVRAHGDSEAVEILDGFIAEASSESPSRGRLRTLFNGLKEAVPTLQGMAELVDKVSGTFT